MFEIKEAKKAKADIKELATYMIYSLKNKQAANQFLNYYSRQLQNLAVFPFAYKSIGIYYHGHVIRMKPFSSYYIFYIVDERANQITILRVLKDRQNWKNIL